MGKARQRELGSLVQAAMKCGCPACFHAALAEAVKDHADQGFARALAQVASATTLPLFHGESAA
jgi:hypothetical protein